VSEAWVETANASRGRKGTTACAGVSSASPGGAKGNPARHPLCCFQVKDDRRDMFMLEWQNQLDELSINGKMYRVKELQLLRVTKDLQAAFKYDRHPHPHPGTWVSGRANTPSWVLRGTARSSFGPPPAVARQAPLTHTLAPASVGTRRACPRRRRRCGWRRC
jgi:hypothetical protein